MQSCFRYEMNDEIKFCHISFMAYYPHRYVFANLNLAIQELDEKMVAAFNFKSRDGVLKVNMHCDLIN